MIQRKSEKRGYLGSPGNVKLLGIFSIERAGKKSIVPDIFFQNDEKFVQKYLSIKTIPCFDVN